MTTLIINQIPIPKDIPLPLPLPEWMLVFVLILSFLIHILFINLMIGGSILTFWYDSKGRFNADFDKLPRQISPPIKVNKGLLVSVGESPRTSCNVSYT